MNSSVDIHDFCLLGSQHVGKRMQACTPLDFDFRIMYIPTKLCKIYFCLKWQVSTFPFLVKVPCFHFVYLESCMYSPVQCSICIVNFH